MHKVSVQTKLLCAPAAHFLHPNVLELLARFLSHRFPNLRCNKSFPRSFCLLLSDGVGHVFENMLILETVKRRSASSVPCHLYYYRTLKGVEIDLLIETRGNLDAYEIKWTQNPDKSAISAFEVLQEDHAIRNKGMLAPLDSPFPITPTISATPWHTEIF